MQYFFFWTMVKAFFICGYKYIMMFNEIMNGKLDLDIFTCCIGHPDT